MMSKLFSITYSLIKCSKFIQKLLLYGMVRQFSTISQRRLRQGLVHVRQAAAALITTLIKKLP